MVDPNVPVAEISDTVRRFAESYPSARFPWDLYILAMDWDIARLQPISSAVSEVVRYVDVSAHFHSDLSRGIEMHKDGPCNDWYGSK